MHGCRIALAALAVAGVSSAATITVDTTAGASLADGFCSLDEAIEAANTNTAVDSCAAGDAGGDTVALPAGTYTRDDSTGGLPAIVEDLVIVGDGPGITVLERDTGSFSGFRLLSVDNASLSLQSLSLRGGDPGAVEVDGASASLAVDDCEVSGNAGRAIIADYGPVSITSSTFTDNIAGGAIGVAYGTLDVADSTFEGNAATSGCGGGAIRTGAGTTISRCRFSYNTADAGGGGAILNRGPLTVSDSAFEGNSAPAGGALYDVDPGACGLVDFGVAATVTGSLFLGNSATYYGGNVAHGNGTLWLRNSTLASGAAGDDGGNLAAWGASGATINNSTVKDGLADADADGVGAGGGVAVLGSSVVEVGNSLLVGNSQGLDYETPDCTGFVSLGYNLVRDSLGCAITGDTTGNLLDVVDPYIDDLADNGGPTLTAALLCGSPAIDAGDPATCEATDQRGAGYARPEPGGAACDIGAFEVQVVVPAANLWLTMFDAPDPVPAGEDAMWSIEVGNAGPDEATAVVVTDTLPFGVDFVSATPNAGACAEDAGVVTCDVGTIAVGGDVTIHVVGSPTVAPTISNTAEVTAAECDPDPADNADTEDSTVEVPPWPDAGVEADAFVPPPDQGVKPDAAVPPPDEGVEADAGAIPDGRQDASEPEETGCSCLVGADPPDAGAALVAALALAAWAWRRRQSLSARMSRSSAWR